jgi:hypothetical protein
MDLFTYCCLNYTCYLVVVDLSVITEGLGWRPLGYIFGLGSLP